MHDLPSPAIGPVVGPGEFVFASSHLEHGHIYGQTDGLLAAGGELKWVYDPDPAKVAAYLKRYPQAQPAHNLRQILDDPEVKLVASAAVPAERSTIGGVVMDSGKDYFTDKAPFTTLEQLARTRQEVARTGRKYLVYYSERLHSECSVCAGYLIEQGAIGRVLQVLGLGPHRLHAASRPEWFFRKASYGGILCDIGSHQVEQFLSFTGAREARVTHSLVANYAHPTYPELEDYGEASLLAENGATGFFRVDWFNPAGLSTWGDGRTFILGTEGYIELRKNVDVARQAAGDHLYLVDGQGEQHLEVQGKIGFPFFGQLILDCLYRTEHAMTQEHAFQAAELSLQAQAAAIRPPGV